jgi:hypothetical protein
VDSGGNPVVVGWTKSPDFPTQNAVQSTCGPAASIDRFYCTYTPTTTCGPQPNGNPEQSDAFVAKFNPSLSQLVFSTFLGGSSNDSANIVTVNPAGEIFIAGTTQSVPDTHAGCPASGPLCGNDPPDQFGLPTTANAFMQPPVAGGCTGNPYSNGPFPSVFGWFAKFSPAGALDYSSYFAPDPAHTGGSFPSTIPTGIALDASGNVYIAGSTNDSGFTSIAPTTVICGSPTCGNGQNYDGWVAKFNLNNTGASQVVYSTLFGGSGNDYVNAMSVDAAGSAYTTGNTGSSDFPTTPGAFVTQYGGNGAAFVTKLTPPGNSLAYSTFLTGNGASQVVGNGISVDAGGAAAVVGGVGGGGFTFPLVDPVQPSLTGATSGGYLVRMAPDGKSTLFSTYLGYNSFSLSSVKVDNGGNAYVAGSSANFPTTSGAYQPCPNLNNCGSGSQDVVVAKVNMCTNALTDISGFMQVARGGMRYVHASGSFLQTVTVTNTGGSTITGPIFLVIGNLSADATLANATGASTCSAPGAPYVQLTPSGVSLAPGQSASAQLQFSDPTMGAFTYTTAVLNGAGIP